nr:glucohydrolase [Lachnospiraceae bacterium]
TTFIDESPVSTIKPVEDLAEKYKHALFNAQKRVENIGLLSNIIENHDEPRGVSRYIASEDLSDKSKKMLAGVYFLRPGIPFIYQGQEIGMENLAEVKSLDELDDCANSDIYKRAIEDGLSAKEALKLLSLRSRDNARTPFQWSSADNAGFSNSTPWLKVNPNYTKINLEKQQKDPDSVFSFYKKLIKLRKNPEYSETFVYGKFEPWNENIRNFLAYTLKSDKNILVAANYQDQALSIKTDIQFKKLLLSNNPQINYEAGVLSLNSYDFIVIEF